MRMKGLNNQYHQGSVKATMLAVMFIVALIVAGYFLRDSNKSRQATVVESVDAGHLVGMSFISNTFSADHTKIETNKDTYIVRGKLQAEKGATFRLEKRLNKQKFLCETASNACWKLVF